MLVGELVRLRAFESTDLERVFTWINDREVTRFLTARYPVSHADEQRWLESGPANSIQGVRLAIETRGGVHIGSIGLHRLNAEDRNAHLGIMIGDKAYWSNGHGTDAITTLLRFAFGEMNLRKVSLHLFDFNDRALACYKKCGFQEEARLRQHYFGEGRYWDVFAMGVLRDEFEESHGLTRPAAAAETSS